MALNQGGMGPVFTRSESTGHPYYYHPYTDMEKRQLFLRSYQFSRKKTIGERIRGSFFRVKRVIWVRLRSARKIRKILWFRLRYGLFYAARKRKFLHLHSPNNNNNNSNKSCSSSCFW
ncbi:Lamin tail domain-containing protein [Actinidia chinensis var. chinensis]|uniref:Lamin tail domain-containing protein n=1 Tax=Actinidia chinensis var. chinensis TaxID=1590841 RepID=A0A2R6QIJ8_ACTCC|nr:Lamin tail domain-containing protein [Actinidia chinensis var. chinensis]